VACWVCGPVSHASSSGLQGLPRVSPGTLCAPPLPPQKRGQTARGRAKMSDSHKNQVAANQTRSSPKQTGLNVPKTLKLIYNTAMMLLFASAFWFFIRGEVTLKWFPRGAKHLAKTHVKDENGLLVLTPEELNLYDGTSSHLPIYLAINGKVFDVSKGRQFYGPEGGYSVFAGRDASRAFITGCFETHLTHDLRGLSVEKQESLKKWTSFFENSEKYHLVGHVLNPEIDLNAPIPEDC
jgi:predicted heme/steroid binding protein